MKNIKIVLGFMWLNYETPNMLSRFPLSLTLIVTYTRVRTDGRVFCGARFPRRVSGIGSESWCFWGLSSTFVQIFSWRLTATFAKMFQSQSFLA